MAENILKLLTVLVDDDFFNQITS